MDSLYEKVHQYRQKYTKWKLLLLSLTHEWFEETFLRLLLLWLVLLGVYKWLALFCVGSWPLQYIGSDWKSSFFLRFFFFNWLIKLVNLGLHHWEGVGAEDWRKVDIRVVTTRNIIGFLDDLRWIFGRYFQNLLPLNFGGLGHRSLRRHENFLSFGPVEIVPIKQLLDWISFK